MTTREFRLSERRDARAGGTDGPSVTEHDRQTLADYAEKLDEAIALLEQEVAAIKNGQLDAVNTIYPRKAELLKWIELRAPLVEPFLATPAAQERDLPAKLATFKTVLEEDSTLLQRMSNVAASIAREIEKVLNRGTLNGLYGKSGQKLSNTNDARLKLDQQI